MMQKKLLAMLLASLSGMSYAVCNSNMIPTAPNSRYQLLNNATEVKDLKTNLIWQRCSLGQTWGGAGCAGTATTHTWQNAMQASQNIGADWRLPNIRELQSLAELACVPSINETIFPDTIITSYYWSSSPVANDNYNVWIIFLGSSTQYYNNHKYNNYYVRLVRSAE